MARSSVRTSTFCLVTSELPRAVPEDGGRPSRAIAVAIILPYFFLCRRRGKFPSYTGGSVKKIRLILIDDHPVVRSGLRTVAEVDEGIDIVGDAASAAEGLEVAKTLRPDAILLDMRLPDRSGVLLCRDLKALDFHPRVLFLTSFADNELVLSAMDAGADGYLLKSSGPREIAAALRTVLSGGAIFEPISNQAGEAAAAGAPLAKDVFRHLSPQELRALEAVAAGASDKDAAEVLGLTAKTVRNYLSRAFQKLGVQTRTQAALLYVEKFGRPRRAGEQNAPLRSQKRNEPR